MASSISIFRDITDPRAANAQHRLGHILILAVASALCGGETCVDFAQFACSERGVMTRLIGDCHPPSHDKFNRVLRLLDPTAFQTVFARFAAAFAADLGGGVAIDGKALRRAYEAGLAASPLLMVTAWASRARLALAAAMPGDGENEVEAALAVVAVLDLEGCVVSIDSLEIAHGRQEARSIRLVSAPGLGADGGFPGVARSPRSPADAARRPPNAGAICCPRASARSVRSPSCVPAGRSRTTCTGCSTW